MNIYLCWIYTLLIIFTILLIILAVLLCLRCNATSATSTSYNTSSTSTSSTTSTTFQYTLAFEDLFKNDSNWNYFVDKDPTHSCSRYTKSVCEFGSDGLQIPATLKIDQGFITTRLQSKRAWGPYGYFEAKIKMKNNSKYAWPAFWLVPVDGKYGDWPKSGEIDIMETVWTESENNMNHNTLHCGKTLGPSAYTGITTTAQPVDFSTWHTFGVDWQPTQIRFYIDAIMTKDGLIGNTTPVNTIYASQWKSCSDVGTSTAAPFDGPMNIVINLAVGGDWAGANTACYVNANDYTTCNTGCAGLASDVSLDVGYVKIWTNDSVI